MNMKLLTNAAAKDVCLSLAQNCDDIYIAVAWAGKNSLVDKIIENKRKIRKVVVGTHMYQTDPEVLRRLMPIHEAKCMPPDGALFHPKIYLFQTGQRASALVGSHNLTSGAFDGPNLEASVLLEGDTKNTVLEKLRQYIEKAWDAARKIDVEFLFPYEKQYEANKAKLKALNTFHPLKKPRPGAKGSSPVDITWTEFTRQVQHGRHSSLPKGLNVLECAARLFQSSPSFAAMQRNERKAVAGTYGKTENGIDGLPWGWFGSMLGQGDFKNLVNEKPEGLSNALDEIPIRGEVQQKDYDAFVEHFKKAFLKKTHKGGIATASRLLAMKRPDIFVCLAIANKRGLCDALGVASSAVNISNYWESVIVPIQLSPWWRHDLPKAPLERRIWHNRAALLDYIYYDPSSKRGAKR